MARLILAFIALFSTSVIAQPTGQCNKSSPAHTIALLELYSSEGCSSCPPADQFVRQLYKDTGLNSDQVIPLALHVDYWDYIGWKDPFAKPLHTERQQFLSTASGSRFVYTPEFFLNGHEYRPSRNDFIQSVKSINRLPAQADIQMSLSKIQKNQLPVKITAKSAQASLLFIALVESNLQVAINAGENAGVTLHHDAVLRSWGPPRELETNNSATFEVSLEVPDNLITKNLTAIAFVQNSTGKILQALSLPLASTQCALK